jgi:hypothetical protein
MSLKLVPVGEFLRSAAAPTKWVIEPFLVEGSAMMLYGRQGVGKSTLAWQLAHSLSTGVPWLGYPVFRTGRTLYLNLDMPAEEFQMLMKRARREGISGDDVFVPIGESPDFNAFQRNDRDQLTHLVEEQQIANIIVDTVADAFHPGTISDVNAEARAVIAFLRSLVPHGALVYLLHERKQSPYKKAEEAENDPDAFSGATAWEGKATSSLRLTQRSSTARLHAKKCRIALPGFDVLQLARTDNGLFEAAHSHQQMLRFWPRYVPPHERFTPRTKADIFDDIAERTGEPFETVKQTYYRGRKAGTYYPWEELIDKADVDIDSVTT